PHSVAKLPHKLETWFHLLNLGPLVAINILFYDIGFWRDYRVLSVHLLLSLLVLIAFERYAFLKVTLAINLLVLPFFVDAYSFYRGPHSNAIPRSQPSKPKFKNISSTTHQTMLGVIQSWSTRHCECNR